VTLDEYIAATDWSDLYSTAPGAVRAICMAAASVSPATILELGSHRGLSAAALSLACPWATVTAVDLGDEVPPEVRTAHYDSVGVPVVDVQCSSAEYLARCGEFDVIFHDSIHGEAAIDEYRAAWAKTRKILAIHDWDQVNRDIGLEPPPREHLGHVDARGRITAILWK
jgi:protein-L-isoaspartate O-methyltransferase